MSISTPRFFYDVISTLDVNLVVNALIATERKNLLTLVISISNVEDIKILTRLTFLVHLHVILDWVPVDKNSILSIAHYLQHFTFLESFILTANCVEWSIYDQQEVLSTFLAKTPARNVNICFDDLQWTSTLGFDDKIVSRHLKTISYRPYNNSVP